MVLQEVRAKLLVSLDLSQEEISYVGFGTLKFLIAAFVILLVAMLAAFYSPLDSRALKRHSAPARAASHSRRKRTRWSTKCC